jgi:hypothetical protein
LRPDDYTSDTRIIPDIVALLQEIYEMEKLALITSGNVVFGLTNIAPGKMKPEGEGRLLFELMELFAINLSELNTISAAISK